MSISAITTGAQTVTATGAVTATTGLDISGVTKDATIHLRVQGLSAATGTPIATIQLEDSVNGFTASLPVALVEVQGTVLSTTEKHFSWRKYELPNCRFGVTSAVLRTNVVTLAGTTPSLTLDSYLEQ